jgi:hypothetical protein
MLQVNNNASIPGSAFDRFVCINIFGHFCRLDENTRPINPKHVNKVVLYHSRAIHAKISISFRPSKAIRISSYVHSDIKIGHQEVSYVIQLCENT